MIGWDSLTSMLITRVNGWSLTYCRCLGIKFQIQKSEVKSEKLVVERSLKLDVLNLNWLGDIDGPPLCGHFWKQYLEHCTPTMKKKEKERKMFACLETRARFEGYMVKIFKTWCPKPWLVGSHRPQCLLEGWIGAV